MLIKDFYTIQDFMAGNSQIKAAILLNVNHEVYKGHFPGQPVVPGVIQIQILRELSEKAFGRKLFIGEVSSAKYLNMIVPGDKPIIVEIGSKPIDDGYRINGVIKNEEHIFSKIKMRLK